MWLVREHSNLKAFTAYPNVKRASTAPFPNDMRKVALISDPSRLVPIASATLLKTRCSDPALKPLETLYMAGLGISKKSDWPRNEYVAETDESDSVRMDIGDDVIAMDSDEVDEHFESIYDLSSSSDSSDMRL
ncbi:hypothetical protein TRV_06547 [Trichophyton verrucosum HKI 0517]|uniref:Uncharacterized protein n=1 Tax=Trichophyton verrucosum (strain HKI 0517) TaxID=663202 RepID=D4DH92_TRIVH|nr:uncharacterized protein TRV_06547 [Trichophyton verrucosum HKI 0517]EFE38788.1 hypothetical protein TRV_06547 [Trichophyton verrucosum HKI 0517]